MSKQKLTSVNYIHFLKDYSLAIPHHQSSIKHSRILHAKVNEKKRILKPDGGLD